ncbi:ribosomal-protein-alanine acetyltransferase [Marinomonas piezotolerans]|uniref:Ribosomal-protein-alanine acetyltransferase n=1 Tax=Marinomonas piezotolerans TaxID=2213058 RepID=A0A370U5S1_9GAMM|nr:peptidase C39 family protein [Marinomonas piezotolerans]RDL43130.1 ribosomal-protein-alanine acetyltransferase [Marinomonas piezotolerans]
MSSSVVIRVAQMGDLDALDALEKASFHADRMSRRSLRHGIKSEASVMLIAHDSIGEQLLGYALVHLFKGRAHARLYSLAVSPSSRGKGIGAQLLEHSEKAAAKHGCISLRLEVSESNLVAIELYEKAGFRRFGRYSEYYQDASSAIRMHKRVRLLDDSSTLMDVPYVSQRTPFTCGPASLLMVLSASKCSPNIEFGLELDIWREATTIYMTSGHGGCHPLGLALAGAKRGLESQVWLSDDQVLFADGVRDDLKKEVLSVTHHQFLALCEAQKIPVSYEPLSMSQLTSAVDEGNWVLVLISTYRLDNKKAPHWVVVTGYDEQHIYVHDPDCEQDASLVECQFVPVLKREFEKMSKFGRSKLRAAVVFGINEG